MDEAKQFSSQLDRLIIALFALRQTPEKLEDPAYLEKFTGACLKLEDITQTMGKSSDESLACDAKLIWNWLSLPFALNGKDVSVLSAAKAYRAGEKELLATTLKEILKNQERVDLILGDIAEISSEVHKLIGEN